MYKKQQEQTDQRNYVIRPAVKEKFTKNVKLKFQLKLINNNLI